MGVHGLWRLIEPSGKPVPLETLENKILAVDVSIWLHQAIKGFQDSKGAPVPNAHLLGIYHRVCKLLYFKIKPVFIFDGGVPVLKKQTIAKRNQLKSRNFSEAEKLQKQLISTLLKHSAISKVLSEKTKAVLALPTKKTSKYENMYALPSVEMDSTISSSEEEDLESTTDTTDSSPTKHWDLHTIDMSSTHFKSLPVDVRHEILTELKETRKQNSWGRLHELPKQSDDFSSYQMKRLLKRQSVQSALEEAEKEMGGHSLSLAELESILNDHGVVTTNDIGKRIASDENTRYLYIKDVKQALEKARIEQLKLESIQKEDSEPDSTLHEKNLTKADLEFKEDLEKAIMLSSREEPSTSKTEEVCSSNDTKDKLQFSFLENFNDGDFESDVSDETEEVLVKKKMSSAQSYMMEYSGLTPNEICKILNDRKTLRTKSSKGKKVVEKESKNVVEIMSDSDDNGISENSSCVVSSIRQGNLEIENMKPCDTLEDITEQNETRYANEKVGTEIIYKSKTIDIEKIDINHISEHVTVVAESIKTNSIDVLSNSDTSSDEFEEVSEVTKDADSLEIVIDPNKKVTDLFSDILNKKETVKKTIEIVIQPQSELDDDLFNDIFEKNGSEHNEDGDESILVSNPKSEAEVSGSEMKNYEKDSVAENSELSISSQNVLKSTAECENDTRELIKSGEMKKSASEETLKLQRNVESESLNLNFEQLAKLKNDLQKEKIDILVEKSTKERMASNITDQMYQEAQDLLELFGVPYIVAPMEAEAQCAFLDAIELTDGTITDDSDIWLFGGRTVYKNFFNQSKYVMEFKTENIKHHFKLTREQMILLALLVGSDYTIGLQGVGPVTALEILAAFPPTKSKEFKLSHAELLSGLKEFRSWFNKGKSAGPGRFSLKNKLKNVAFTDNFPSLQVVQAYLEPTVETSRDKFSWSKPDFVGLTDFAKEKFGWSPKKTEEILKPVIKRVEENQAQKSIKEYFKTVYKADSTDTQNQMSKRVKSAINRIGKTPEELIAEEMEALSKEKQKRSRIKKNSNKNIDDCEIKSKEAERQTKQKRSRKKKNEDVSGTSKEPSLKVHENDELCGNVEKPKRKKLKDGSITVIKHQMNTITVAPAESSEQTKPVDENSGELKKYEDIAQELRKRRQRRNELSKKDIGFIKKKKPTPKKPTELTETIPKALEEDEEIQLLKATTSKSLKRTEEIDREIKNELRLEAKKQCLPSIHKGEIIHQKLRDKSDLLKNKLKAIEVFRKSKKGPGYVPKRGKQKILVKEDAELSENSSDD